MANAEQLVILKQGVEVWNEWREENFETSIDLLKANLSEADLGGADLDHANLSEADLTRATLIGAKLRGADLRRVNLSGANLRQALLSRANLSGANLTEADLSGADLREANFSIYDGRVLLRAGGGRIFTADLLTVANLSGADLREADLSRANLGTAIFNKARLQRAKLIEANLTEADLSEADLTGANLSRAQLVGTDVNQTKISGSSVYGINVWDLKGDFEQQKDLVITLEGQPAITVDNVQVAQFIYLILNNEKLRDVINTITSKSVLILGRFGPPERKAVLDELRNKLREYNLLPIVFDFERPDDRDYTETVQTLAGLSMFVIVDVTNPKSTPMEMEATVKQFKIPYVPIIDLSADKKPYSMMADLQNSFHWVLETYGYSSKEELIENIDLAIIGRAVAKHKELTEQKATKPKVFTLADLKKDNAET